MAFSCSSGVTTMRAPLVEPRLRRHTAATPLKTTTTKLMFFGRRRPAATVTAAAAAGAGQAGEAMGQYGGSVRIVFELEGGDGDERVVGSHPALGSWAMARGARSGEPVVLPQGVRSIRYCSPRHRLPYEGSECVGRGDL